MLDLTISDNFKTYTYKNISKIDEEKSIDNRIEAFIRIIKRIHKDVIYIKLIDDNLGGMFKAQSIVFGIKKTVNFEKYLDEFCIICFKKPRNLRRKRSILRKLKLVDNKYQKLILEKVKGESNDLKVDLCSVEFVCPIFCVRHYNDYDN